MTDLDMLTLRRITDLAAEFKRRAKEALDEATKCANQQGGVGLLAWEYERAAWATAARELTEVIEGRA